MKRTRRDPPTPHDRYKNLPRPHVVLHPLPGAGEQMHGKGLEDEAIASGEIASQLPSETSVRQPTEARVQETGSRCPCIRAYSVSLVRLPGGALCVAFFKGEDLKPRHVQDGQE